MRADRESSLEDHERLFGLSLTRFQFTLLFEKQWIMDGIAQDNGAVCPL